MKIPVKPYPFEILRLLTTEGFINRFFELVREEKSLKEAYYRAEEEFLYYFGKTKYSDYESFRKVKERFIKHGKKLPSCKKRY